MSEATVSLTGKEFRQLYDSFVSRMISKLKPEAVDFIKRHIDNMNMTIENRAKATNQYNLSFMVTSGLVSPNAPVDLKAEKSRVLEESLKRFTDGDLDSPNIEVIVGQSRSRLQYDTYYAFKDCDFSDDAVVTLTLQQYRELNNMGASNVVKA
jgi:hypothetical protein